MKKAKNNILFLPITSFIVGIYFQEVFCYKIQFLLKINLMFCFFVLFLFFKQNKKTKQNLIQDLILTLLFCYSGAFLLECQKNNNSLLQNQYSNKKVNFIAYVQNKETNNKNRIKQILTLNIRKIKNIDEKDYKNTNINLLCYSQKVTNTQLGDRIKVTNVKLSSPSRITNPGFSN